MRYLCVVLLIYLSINMTSSRNDGNQNHKNMIKICSWNMRSMWSTASPYLVELLNNSDIVAISEHGLYPCELYKIRNLHSQFQAFSKSAQTLNDKDFGKIKGHSGCAIMWSDRICNRVTPLDIGSDRVCAIECTIEKGLKLFVFAVYLPHSNCKIASFDDELNALLNIILEYQSKGEVICIGDVNAHIGNDLGHARSWGKSTANGLAFARSMHNCNMEIIDMTDICSGPNYTFESWDGAQSYIDHCCITYELLPNVMSCKVLGSEINNTSDHLALSIELKLDQSISTANSFDSRSHVTWDRVTKEDIKLLYTDPLDIEISQLVADSGICTQSTDIGDYQDSIVDIPNLVELITNQILNMEKSLPMKHFKKSLKPYWDNSLSSLNKEKKNTYKSWVEGGRPKDQENPLFRAYKNAKQTFRREQRKKTFEYEKKNFDDICKNQFMDQKFFWHLVSRSKKKKSKIRPIKAESGIMLTDPNEIAIEWGNYFKQLYSTHNNAEYDDIFKETVEREISSTLHTQSTISEFLTGGVITHDETRKHIQKMKNGKAPGWDMIRVEHLKYGGDNLINIITWVMNAVIVKEDFPIQYKKGLLVPIPKGMKDQSIKDNNRGITLLSVLYKLIESIIMDREKDWFKNEQNIDVLQGANQDRCSSLHTSLLLQESIARNLDKGETVYAAFLDIRKAFDSVWIDGLLYMLKEQNLNIKTLRVIANAYDNFQCAAHVNGTTSDWFVPQRGVHQGGPLSMKLYQVFINGLIAQLKACSLGVTLCGENVTCPTFADDNAPLCFHKTGLNILLEIAYKHKNKWRYEFNTDKSVYMVWGKDKEPRVSIVLGNAGLKLCLSVKHMGITLTNDPKLLKETYKERVMKGKNAFYASRGIGSNNMPVPPTVLSKLYWSVAIPSMTYGMEVTPISETGIELMERAHREMAKSAQMVPQNVCNPLPLATIGWLSIAAYVDLKKLCFLFKILCMPENVFRTVIVSLFLSDTRQRSTVKGSPVNDLVRVALKYDVIDMAMRAITNGPDMAYDAVKRQLKSNIWALEMCRWKSTCFLYRGVDLYVTNVKHIEIHAWWHAAHDNPHIARKFAVIMSLLMGSQPVGMQCDIGRHECSLCDESVKPDAHHCIFVCGPLEEIRQQSISRIRHCMPTGMQIEFDRMTAFQKLHFILSGFNVKYTKEWKSVYENIARGVTDIYEKRACLIALKSVE